MVEKAGKTVPEVCDLYAISRKTYYKQMDAKHVWEEGVRKYQRTFIDIFTGFHHAILTTGLTSAETVRAFEEAERVFLLEGDGKIPSWLRDLSY